METVRRFWNKNDIPRGVRVLTFATSVRWFGWGFAEALIPVFLFTFTKSYALTGFLGSAYDVAFIIALPIVGILADRMRGTTLVIIAMFLYLIVGSSYFLAGAFSLVVFVVIARFVNGVGYALDSVGRETYFRRHTPKKKRATVFGYFDSIANFWWIVAALLGIVFVRFFPIYDLLFLIAPTSLITFIIVWWFRKTERKEKFTKDQTDASYKDLVREFSEWDWKLKLITAFNFFVTVAGATVMFFLPIQVYTEGAGYTPVIITGIVMAIPALMGWALGDWFDREGLRVFGYGLLAFAVLLMLLGFVTGYLWQIVIAFVIGIILELLWVGSEALVTEYANAEHFGRVDGIWRSIDDLGGLVGPVVAGIVIEVWGTHVLYFGLTVLILALTVAFIIATRFMKISKRILC